MNDRKNRIKMTDRYSIGKLLPDDNPSASINFRYTDFFSADISSLTNNLTTPLTMIIDFKKRKARPQEEDFLFFANAGKHIPILLWSHVLSSKVKAKLKRACPHRSKETS